MNEVINTIKNRRSVRKFKSDMPSKSDLEKIVEAGLYAPSGMGRQGTKMIVVTDKKMRDKLSKMNAKIGGWDEDFDPFYNAPAIIIVLADKSCPTHVYDGSLVMENLMLSAESLGLGSIWIHRAKEEFETDEMKDLLKALGITGEWEGIGHCAVGYVDGKVLPPANRKENRVFWIEK